MTFDVGSLVRARGREWVVLPESNAEEDLLVLRPLGGTEEEITGVYLPLETVEAARFPPPDPAQHLGNHRSGALLREAVRLGFRSGAGPFRSLARINVEPRPYQLVPLLMALRLDPVRLLIADDVGVGKTVEACLIAREFLDRAEVGRTAVLCPPHLAEQWKDALASQFNLDAALILPGTVSRLERDLAPGESLFDRHPHVVISMDYIKTDRHRHEFLRMAPELIIVDEAHTCTSGSGNRGTQMRHDLLRSLAADENRNLILVTATPHTGKEENFRSLLTLLDPEFRDLPLDLSGEQNRKFRERLARHLVQRRRGDLTEYLNESTPFPDREIAETSYTLHPDYRGLLDRILDYCRERVLNEELDRHEQRIRWWSALALLRALSSSPPAAASTLRNRAATARTTTEAEADEVGKRTVLDLEDETTEGSDVLHGSQVDEDGDSPDRRRLLEFAREVEKLAGERDLKLQEGIGLVDTLLKDGFSPIVFCRFIPTVEYVTAALREHYGGKVVVEAVTGELPPAERERRVEALGEGAGKRVLVCTDCLSEGINLQQHFDAVLHYDLSWNPTRHEQREGRVDRFGQQADVVRTVTFYGQDNPVDGIVLQVLLRKHKAIHDSLGITVPVPMDTNTVVEAIFEGLLLRESAGAGQLSFDFLAEEQRKVDVQWDAAADREKRSRTIFAQHSIKPEEVAHELVATREALGGEGAARAFLAEALPALNVPFPDAPQPTLSFDEAPAALRDAAGVDGKVTLSFQDPAPRGAIRITRTHPMVSGTASFVLESALDPAALGNGSSGLASPAQRCALIRTDQVSEQTVLLLLRLRFHLLVRRGRGPEEPLLAEDLLTVAFRGTPSAPRWLSDEETEALLSLTPTANTPASLAEARLQQILTGLPALDDALESRIRDRGEALREAHQRVRAAAPGAGGRSVRVEPHLPPDLLGVYGFLPAVGGSP